MLLTGEVDLVGEVDLIGDVDLIGELDRIGEYSLLGKDVKEGEGRTGEGDLEGDCDLELNDIEGPNAGIFS